MKKTTSILIIVVLLGTGLVFASSDIVIPGILRNLKVGLFNRINATNDGWINNSQRCTQANGLCLGGGVNNITNNITYNVTGNLSLDRLILKAGSESRPALTFGDDSDGLHLQAVGVIDVNVASQFRIDVNNESTIYAWQAGQFLPSPTNVNSLGGVGYDWSNLYLGAGATLFFNDGDYNISYANKTLNFSGNIKVKYDFSVDDGTLTIDALHNYAYFLTETWFNGTINAQGHNLTWEIFQNNLSTNNRISALTIDLQKNTTNWAGINDGILSDASNITTGILAVARGGTGVGTKTGTDSVVLNNTPTITAAILTGNNNITGKLIINSENFTMKNLTGATVCWGGNGTGFLRQIAPAAC